MNPPMIGPSLSRKKSASADVVRGPLCGRRIDAGVVEPAGDLVGRAVQLAGDALTLVRDTAQNQKADPDANRHQGEEDRNRTRRAR
jgi:hypothetical protein